MSASPSYDLKLIQALVGRGAYHVTHSAMRTAVEVGCDQADMEECVLSLAPSDFYKSMAAEQRPGTMLVCAECGGNIARRLATVAVPVGARGTIDVSRRLQRCESCGEIYYAAGEADAVRREANDEVRRREGLLFPEEIKELRTALGLSQAEFERLLRVGPKTVVRWERGTIFQNRATDTLLRTIRDVPAARAYLLGELAPTAVDRSA